MRSVNPAKVNALALAFIATEEWLQAGSPDPASFGSPFPGSRGAAVRGRAVYGFYRDAFVPVLSAALGGAGILDDLTRLLSDVGAGYPTEFARFKSLHSAPDPVFPVQWANLFGDPVCPGVTHEALRRYQAKYEVEWPLVFLAQLRELLTIGAFDETLLKHRDRAGKLKKGQVAAYIADGLNRYPILQDAVRTAYAPALRNAIGHNEYEITSAADGERAVATLDGRVNDSAETLLLRVALLHEIQNDVLWLQNRHIAPDDPLSHQGVFAHWWGRPAADENGVLTPVLWVCQIAPFAALDPTAGWLDRVEAEVAGEAQTVRIGAAAPVTALVTLEDSRHLAAHAGSPRVACCVVPVMPCVHDGHAPDEVVQAADGWFCIVGPGTWKHVPLTVTVRQ